MTDTLTFDSTEEGPDQKLVEFVRSSYWVCVSKHGHDSVDRGDGWLRSRARPKDVPNGTMYWRRPTYEELLNRQEWQERGLSERDLTVYRRTGVAPDLCVCQHGEDSHLDGILTSPHCQSSCNCHRFRKAES